MLRIEINLKSASSPREKGIQTGFYGLQYQKKEEKKIIPAKHPNSSIRDL